jgi:hypothetical protein
MVSNELVVMFKKGTSPDTIESILENVSGTVIGTIHLNTGLVFYQVRIPDTGDASGVNSAVNTLKLQSEVRSTEPNSVAQRRVLNFPNPIRKGRYFDFEEEPVSLKGRTQGEHIGSPLQ